jgi:hypothetical protein
MFYLIVNNIFNVGDWRATWRNSASLFKPTEEDSSKKEAVIGPHKPQTDASTKDPQISDHHKRRVEFWLSEVGVDGYWL